MSKMDLKTMPFVMQGPGRVDDSKVIDLKAYTTMTNPVGIAMCR